MTVSEQQIKEFIDKEWIKCGLDPIYFMRKYCIIKPPRRLDVRRHGIKKGCFPMHTQFTKKCSRCNTLKHISEFFKNSYSPDGHYSLCKDCYNTQRRQYRKTTHGRQISSNQCKRYHSRYPEKAPARVAVRMAVKRGDLSPIDRRICQKCGEKQAEGYHHESYKIEHWLDVIPLCARCHASH